MENKIIMDEKAVERAVNRISYEIIERNKGADNLCILGILSRGVDLSRKIAAKISAVEGRDVPCGVLDITAFRDDRKAVDTDLTDIPFPLADKHVVLVDDVLYTGRTVRGAIDAVLRRGRAKTIQLAVLVDRGHRELPIRPDFVGKNLPTSRQERVRVLIKERDGTTQVAIQSEGDME